VGGGGEGGLRASSWGTKVYRKKRVLPIFETLGEGKGTESADNLTNKRPRNSSHYGRRRKPLAVNLFSEETAYGRRRGLLPQRRPAPPIVLKKSLLAERTQSLQEKEISIAMGKRRFGSQILVIITQVQGGSIPMKGVQREESILTPGKMATII